MTESLDTILSGQREAVPEKIEEKIEAQAPEQEQQPEAEQPQDAGQQKMVPHEALHAEKQKVKRYTEQVASFEKTLADRDAAWERRFGQLIEKLGPQQQEPAPIDWYADPDAAMGQRLDRAVSPLEQKFSSLETQIIRLTAVQQHGVEKVTAFEKYVTEAMRQNPADPEIMALSAQMRASPDPVGVGIQWYEKKTFDTEAERQRIREEVMKEFQSQSGQPPTSVMPTNLAAARNVGSRAGPTWSGPPALTDIFKR